MNRILEKTVFCFHMSKLLYPKKSHRKTISIPRNCTKLAEFLGIEIGDGSISNGWQVTISLNAVLDEQYASYIEKLIKKLFYIEARRSKIPNEKTIRITTNSTSLVEFLIKN